MELWRLNMELKKFENRELRKVNALEKIARCLSVIEESLLTIVDGNDKSLRMKDIERAKVYSTHLGKKLSKKR